MIVLDTGAVFAYYDRDDQWHTSVRSVLESEFDELILPASVIPELDYLLGKRLGMKARHAIFEDVIEGVYTVHDIPFELYSRIQEIDLRYVQLDLGYVDCSVMAIAQWLKCKKIATLDHRHFAAVARELQFELLP